MCTKGNDGAMHTTVESSSLETIRHMVASGLGISILPLSAVDSHHYAPGVIEVRPLTPPVPFRTVAIAWRASFPRPKAIEILADSIRLCSVAKPPVAQEPSPQAPHRPGLGTNVMVLAHWRGYCSRPR